MENFQSIPEEFNIAEFITSLTKTEEVTEVSRNLQKSVNDILSYLSQPETLPQTRLFLGAEPSSPSRAGKIIIYAGYVLLLCQF